MLYLKLVTLGFAVVGTIGFMIYLVASIIELAAGVGNSTDSGPTGAILLGLLFG